MRKFALALSVLLLLCAGCLSAGAEGMDGNVVRDGEYAAFLDGDGEIFLPGWWEPVNFTGAESLVGIDGERLVFFGRGDAAALISLSLDGFRETVIAEDACAACMSGRELYYIPASDRSRIVRVDLEGKGDEKSFAVEGEMARVYNSGRGVIAVSKTGLDAYITDPLTGGFVRYLGDVARENFVGEGFEAYLTASNELYIFEDGDLKPGRVDENVRAWTAMGRCVYYLRGEDGALELRRCDVDARQPDAVLTLPADIEPQITASRDSLFLLSTGNVIFRVDLDGRELEHYAQLPDPRGYTLDGAQKLGGYRLEAVSGQIGIYGVPEADAAQSESAFAGSADGVQPKFTFVSPANAGPSGESAPVLLSSYPVGGEDTAWSLLRSGAAPGGAEEDSEKPEADAELRLPDPRAWLGGRIEPYEQDSVEGSDGSAGYHYVHFHLASKDLPAAKAYVELLQDERFGLRLSDELQDQLTVIVSGESDTVYTFDRVDGAVSPINPPILPSNVFGDVVAVIVEWSGDWTEDYASLYLAYADGFQPVDGGDVYEGAKDLVDFDAAARALKRAKAAATAKPTATPKPTFTPKPTSTPKPSKAPEKEEHFLPSPDAWLGHKIARTHEGTQEDGGGSSHRYVTFELDLEDLPAFKGYMKLLKDDRFGLELSDKVVNDTREFNDCVYTYYVFERKDGGAKSFQMNIGDGIEGDVVLLIAKNYGKDQVKLKIHYGNSFDFSNFGDEYADVDSLSDPPKRGSGSDSSSGGSHYDYDDDDDTSSRRRCTSCHGSGEKDCMTCYGKGYIEEYVSSPNFSGDTHNTSSRWERHDCTNIYCRNGKVECRTCGGDGWID